MHSDRAMQMLTMIVAVACVVAVITAFLFA